MAKKHWIGFDLGGTKMQATVFDDAFKIVGQERKKTKAQEGVDRGLERMGELISEALERAGVSKKELSGIGVGCPGPLHLDDGVILNTPNLGWKNVEVKKTLESAFKVPTFILNDVDAGVYGEYKMGAARKARCAVGLFPGTGLGGGCVYEGKVLRGKSTSSMEIGHMLVQPEGPLCGCGQHGCLEALTSRLAISAAAAAAAYRGDAPHLLEETGTDLSKIKSGALARAIDKGDTAIEIIVREAAQWLGYGVANIVNLLAPDVVVLGGGLVEAMPKLFKEEVMEFSSSRVMASFRKTYRIEVAQLGDDAGVTGAAAWAEKCVSSGK